MYILAIVLGILLVAYISYLFAEILRALIKGEEPKNTLCPFLHKVKQTKAAETVQAEGSQVLATSKEADIVPPTREKTFTVITSKDEEAQKVASQLEQVATEKKVASSPVATEPILAEPAPNIEPQPQQSSKASFSEETPSEVVNTTVKAREAKKYN